MRLIFLLASSVLLLSAASNCVAQTAPPDLYNNAPSGCWMQASDGNLYTQGYKFNLTTLAAPTTFPLPSCNFFQGTDSNFYSWSSNIIYKVTLAGVQATFATLTSAQGAGIAGLIQGNDGNFYGVAGSGGAYSDGTIFSVSSAGTVTALYSFTGGPDGKTPGNLLQANDGNLYGTTSSTVFSATLAGQLTTIANVGGSSFLIQGSGGYLYGLFSGDFDSVSLSGTVTTVATADSLGLEFGIEGPCYIDGAENFDCSTLVVDESSNSDETLLTITPSGGGGTGYEFPTPGTNGNSTATYSLAGNGNFYGYYSAYGSCGEGCEPGDSVAYLYGGFATTKPITIEFDPYAVAPGQSSRLLWQADNAISYTMQQCFASGGWSGTQSNSGITTITAPSTPGNYHYAITCGGVETNAAILQVGVPSVALTASPSEFATGSNVTLTATVTGTTSGTPTGKVTFMDGSLVLGSAALNGSGVASLTLPTKGVPAGNYSVTASYGGSTVYAAEVSSAVAITVLAKKYTSYTGLSLSATTVKSGSSITLTATVTGSGEPSPTGSVSFYSGSTLLTKAALTSNPLSITLPTTGIAPGSYPVTATYSGDAVWAPSTSASQTVTVTTSYTPTVALTASPSSVTPPAQVTLTCTVTGVNGQAAPTGTVYFYLGSTYLGADSLNGSGVASFATSTAGDPAGTYAVSATYLGDSNYAKTSASASVTVQ